MIKISLFMLIDYIGIPGCGKTYQTNLAKVYCLKEGISFVDISHGKNASLFVKLLLVLSEKSLLLTSDYKRCVSHFKTRASQASPKYLPFSLEYCVQRILGAKILAKLFRDCRKVAFNDEGVFQWVVFLSLQYGIPIKEIIDTCSLEKVDSHTIYISISEMAAFGNIKKRNRHVCEMDEMRDSELMDYLKEFNNSCNQLNHLLNFKKDFRELI